MKWAAVLRRPLDWMVRWTDRSVARGLAREAQPTTLWMVVRPGVWFVLGVGGVAVLGWTPEPDSWPTVLFRLAISGAIGAAVGRGCMVELIRNRAYLRGVVDRASYRQWPEGGP